MIKYETKESDYDSKVCPVCGNKYQIIIGIPVAHKCQPKGNN